MRIGLLAAATMALMAPSLASSQAVPPATPSPHPYLTLEQLRAQYGDKQGKITKIDGVELYYKDEGKGPAILMVHGSRSSLKQWDGVVARLKDRYRIIRYDIPAAGLSGPVSDEIAANVQPTDLAEKLLGQLGVKKITFVGVSSGGTLGLFLAAKRPDLVERIVLSNTPADPVRYDHLVYTPSFAAAQKRVAETKFEDEGFWKEYLGYFSGKAERISPATIKTYYDLNRRVPEKNPVALVAKIGDGKVAHERIAQVKAPVMLVWGGADPLLTPKAAVALENYLTASPQISRVFLPDVGHYPPTEVPARFAQIVATFIEAANPQP